MKNIFSNISEFLALRDCCIFCGSKLKPSLTNYVLLESVPTIKSAITADRLVNDCFSFKMNYVTKYYTVNVDGQLNIYSNELRFNKKRDNTADITKIVEIFQMYKPHIVLSCENKKCMNYAIHSNFLTCEAFDESLHDIIGYVNIKPFLMYFECVDIGKYWVQSDYIYNTTRIMSRNNSNMAPIETPFINFELFDSNKLKNRILTIVTFT